MRVPFPIKAFLAFLVVVAAGAIPTYVYIETSFVTQLTSARVDETAHRASLLTETLRPLSRDGRLRTLQAQAKVTPERITYLGPTGVALYDSTGDDSALRDYSTRPEVIRALGGEPRGATMHEVPGAGIGAATRTTGGVENIFVAIKIDEGGEVLRIGFATTDVNSLANNLLAAFRNGQALALSVALLLSVLAAFVFMRPLQRLARSAQSIARGDYTASQNWRGSDEIGDVGIALNTMARELRQRLATAHASETLLIQAAEYLDLPVAIVGGKGEIVVINGAFRTTVEDSSTDAEDVVSRVLSSKKYAKAHESLRSNGGDGVLRWTKKKIGVALQMHLLERPGTEPLVLLTTHADNSEIAASLPRPSDVRSLPLGELLDAAIARAAPRLPNTTIDIDYVNGKAGLRVVEVEGRVELALAVFLEGAARGVERLKLCVSANDVTVELWVDGEISAAPIRLVRQLLGPCGGRVMSDDDIALHLARA